MNTSRFIKTFVTIILTFLIIALFYLNPIALPQFRLKHIWIARILVLLSLLSLSGYVFFAYIVQSQLKEWIKNVSLMMYSFFVLFFVLEGIFTFIPYSHGVGYTLASHNWFKFYWKKNNYGYRDRDMNLLEDTTKKKIFIIGDSFTAGQGIRDADKRYTDILQHRLNGDYLVYNLGKTGSDTRDEYRRLVRFPVKPDIIILQYFGNDIMESAYETHQITDGSTLFTPYNNVPVILRSLIKNSYLVNFVYWKLPQSDLSAFNEFVIQSYKNSEILKKHFKDLDLFIEYSSLTHSKLMVMIFPYMTDIEVSKCFTIPIESHFVEKKIPVLNLTSLIGSIPLQFRIVNDNDAHPGEQTHKMVADTLFMFLNGKTANQNGFK